jgi:hypothetical protein
MWVLLRSRLPERNAEYAWRDHRVTIVDTNGGAHAYVVDHGYDPARWAVVPFVDLDTDNALAAEGTVAEFVDAMARRSSWWSMARV